MALKKGQGDHVFKHPRGHFMIYLLYFGQTKVDHKLAFFWPKTILSAEWEGWVDHVFKPSLATFF